MKIGLVSPYVYPLPGGVTAARPPPLREPPRCAATTSGSSPAATASSARPRATSSGSARASRCPTNGSVGTLTVSPRYVSQVRDVLEREQFDLLHFHEPFVPFLSLFVLRESRSVNVATFHAYGGFSPAYEFGSKILGGYASTPPRPDRGQRRRPPLHRPLLPGRLQGHPQRRRRRPAIAGAVPIARWQDGTQNLLFVGRHEPRKGLLDLLKAYRILRKTGCTCRLLVAGSGPQEREARRYVLTRRLQGVEFLGRVSDDEKAQLFRTADVYVSPATGGESFGIVLLEAMAAGTPIVCSDIHGYKGVVRRGARASSCRRASPRRSPPRSAQLLDDPELRAQMARGGRQRAEEFSWERVTAKVDDYYGFVIRRLAAQGQLPADFHAEVPPSPRIPVAVDGLRADPASPPLGASPPAEPPAPSSAARSASAIRQTHARSASTAA